MKTGRPHRAARPERRRQVDAAAHHRRAGEGRTPARCSSTARTPPPCRRGTATSASCSSTTRRSRTCRCTATSPSASRSASGPKDEIRRRVHELLELVHLEQFADRLPAQLSGGQRQRMALARALAVEPRVLLLDEPFGALDAKVRKELRDWLRRLHDEMQVTTVFVTHDQEEALEVSDEIVVINQGRIEQIGSPGGSLRQAGERVRHVLPRPGDHAGRPAGPPPRHRDLHRPAGGCDRGAGRTAAADRVRGAGRDRRPGRRGRAEPGCN